MNSQAPAKLCSTEFIVPEAGALAEHEVEIRRSTFITWVSRADDDVSARELISLAKEQYPDARHHCSAFIYEVDGANRIKRSSDDGEPSGTAGRPMLDVLEGSGLTNIAAVVIRYFGGIKLGTGGLVRAYSDSVTQCLPLLPKSRRTLRELRVFHVAPAAAGRIEAELRNRGFEIVDTQWAEKVGLTIAIEPSTEAMLDSTLAALTSGEIVETHHVGTRWVETRC